jgi:ABC-type branched-subunit amino acid transport system permease subunit
LQQIFLFALLGLGSGAIYATVAEGLVLMHRSSGVINFAHAALAVYAIYAYLQLRSTGELMLPVPGVRSVSLGDPMAFAPAFALSVLCTAAIGAAAYLLVFRALERAPVLAQIVATVGLLLAIVGQIELNFPSQAAAPQFAPQILPADPVTIFGATVQQDRLWLAGLAILAAALLAALYKYSTFGLATRAAAASPKGAMLVGRDPKLIALGNWVLASALAGVFGVLVAPLIPIAPSAALLFLVPSLAAAMVAGFRSFGIACATGIGLGILQSELVDLQTNNPWLPAGLQVVAPLVLIIVVAFLRGNTTLRRGDFEQARLPASPRPRRVGASALAGLAVAGVGLTLVSGDIRLGLIVTLISFVVCLSSVLITGYVGQASMMQVTFAGLAGLLVGTFASGAGVPFPFAPLLAIAVTTGLGLVIGIPALRVRGTSLAVVTLAAGVATEQLVFLNSTIVGGVEGHQSPAPHLLGIDFDILGSSHYPSLAFGFFVLVFAVIAAVAVANLRRSPSGIRLLAVRANERAAASSGIDVPQTKLIAFALAALIAGLGGALFAYQQVRLSPSSFGIEVSLVFLVYAYLGGITSIKGALFGALLIPNGLVLALIDRVIAVGDYQVVVSGVVVMVAAVAAPDGIAGACARFAEQLRRRDRSPAEVALPAAEASA